MKCEVCRGACCESLFLPLFSGEGATVDDANRWFGLHARQSVAVNGHLEIEARCRELTPAGRCNIYPSRPLTCQLYEAGGPGCMRTVRERRTHEQYLQIRDERDPARIHPLGDGTSIEHAHPCFTESFDV